jgi:hypothetical protein
MELYLNDYSNKDLADIVRSMQGRTHSDIINGNTLCSQEWKKFLKAFPHTKNPGAFYNFLKMIIVDRFLEIVE